jgi:hypothetical protein
MILCLEYKSGDRAKWANSDSSWNGLFLTPVVSQRCPYCEDSSSFHAIKRCLPGHPISQILPFPLP